MDHAEIWIPLGGFALALAVALASAVRYFDKQVNDKLSVGEFTRQHDALMKSISTQIDRLAGRVRDLERWQDRANGAYGRYHSKKGDEYG